MIEKRSFFKGIDGDTSPRLLDFGASLNLMNSRVGATEFGRDFRLENVPGTTLLSQSVLSPYGLNQVIGSCVDEEHDRILAFVYNSFGNHMIYSYETLTDTVYPVLYDSQVTGGLNFSKSSLIHSAFVVNGILYWPDSTNNQPRAVNIDSGIKANRPTYSTTAKAYTIPVNFSEITLVKPPPVFTPSINKYYDAAFTNNFIGNDSFQFAFQYEYYTREVTVVGAYSRSSRLNKPNDNYNYIKAVMSLSENIPNSVRFVNLIVRQGTFAKIVKTWDKEVTSDAAAIAAQNAGTTALSFNFYNNITGQAIDKAYVLKPYDNVPYYAKTAAAAKNRGFWGNTVSGDDTPTSTSLALSLNTTNITNIGLLKNLISFKISWNGSPNKGYSAWYVYITELQPIGYYVIDYTERTNHSLTPPNLVSAPPYVPIGNLIWVGLTEGDVISYLSYTVGYPRTPFITQTSFTTINCTITGVNINVYDVFKNRSQYKAGVQFYDFAMRYVGGIVTNDTLLANINTRNYSYSTGVTGITWTLDNTSATTEIPDNAYYYSVNRTLNLNTRFFIEGFDNRLKYATKDANGAYVFQSTLFTVTGIVGLAINTSALVSAGLGYSFQEGDICVLIKDNGTTYELPVIGQSGNYVILKAQDINNGNSIVGIRCVYEIYSPYQTSDQEPFYNMGSIYKVINPTTNSRTYGTLTDTFLPDCYVVSRTYSGNTYNAETMSPNDFYYSRWDTDDGKLSLVTKLGRETKPYSFSFSDVYIPGTATNGLSSFEALNQSSVPPAAGELNRLILTEKIQDKGTVMLAIGRNEVCSVYLGETQITDNTGATQFFAQSSGVVGTIYPLKGSFGTVNPESVVQYLGLVFWIDVNNGVFMQYSVNGLDQVSKYKMSRFFKRYCQAYIDSSTANLDNINGWHHIRCSIDQKNNEVAVSLPALIYENYADTLPSYTSVPSYATSIVNRFDIYDGLQKTMCFSFDGDENIWGSNFEYGAEWLEYMGNIMYGFKAGKIYTFNTNTTNWNTFFGVQKPVRACITGNANPSELKVLNNVCWESNAAPDFTVAMTECPNIQISDLASGDYTDQEGLYYASFFKDRLSPNVSGTADQKLYTGDDLTDIAIMIMGEWQQYSSLFFCNFANIGYAASRGQKQILNPVNKL